MYPHTRQRSHVICQQFTFVQGKVPPPPTLLGSRAFTTVNSKCKRESERNRKSADYAHYYDDARNFLKLNRSQRCYTEPKTTIRERV